MENGDARGAQVGTHSDSVVGEERPRRNSARTRGFVREPPNIVPRHIHHRNKHKHASKRY